VATVTIAFRWRLAAGFPDEFGSCAPWIRKHIPMQERTALALDTVRGSIAVLEQIIHGSRDMVSVRTIAEPCNVR